MDAPLPAIRPFKHQRDCCSRVFVIGGLDEGDKNKKVCVFDGEFCHECLESEFQQWQLQQQQQDE